jgi:glutathione S-transferase
MTHLEYGWTLLRLNPKAVVPTLIHGDRVITDSAVIIKYLEKQFPEPSLSFANPKLQTQMNNWINLQDRFPMRELMYGNFQGIEGLVLRRSVQIKEKLLPQLIQLHPELQEQYLAKLKDVRQWNSTIQNKQKIAEIDVKIAPMLDRLEKQLSQTHWLCGATYSLADIVWTTILNGLNGLKCDYLWIDNTRPALKLYFNRLKSRPSFTKIIQQDKMPSSMLIKGLYKIIFNNLSWG